MKKVKNSKGDHKTRQLMINEAARLMYKEGVSQYHTAKHLAARNVLSRGGKYIRVRNPSHLPSNGEISAAVDALADLYEGEFRGHQLFEMRVLALDYMQQLHPFYPRLIGSVSTGRIKRSSDIDIHVFTDELENLIYWIEELAWFYSIDDVTIQQNGKLKNYTHIYIEDTYPIELSVYPKNDIRVRGRSSTDGKPIIRIGANSLMMLIFAEHGEQWCQYIETSTNEKSAL